MTERPEVTTLILKSAYDGVTKTTLMHECYLSFGALQEYLTLLLDRKLLEYIPGEMKYKTTERGREIISDSLEAMVDNKCSHQCIKCGCLYYCDDVTRCKFPYLHGNCQGCSQFLVGHKIREEWPQVQELTMNKF